MRLLIYILLLAISLPAISQSTMYDPNPEYPFGRPNPSAPEEIKEFGEMIGSSECISIQRRPDGTWLDSLKMTWNFKYIMNGTAVQDEVFSEDERYAGSLRQYQADSAKWYVSYYSSRGLPPYPFWTGKRENDKIVLNRPNSVVNNKSGTSRLTFYDLSENSFSWMGEWLSDDGTIEFVFWKISCNKKDASP